MRLTREVRGLIGRFNERLGLDASEGRPGVHILENPTEEIADGIGRGRPPKLFGAGAGAPLVAGRLEENYLFYTRRFPNNTANDTIGSGALSAQDYLYFINGVGDQGSAAGYASIPNMTLQQTNMASGGKIPTGRGFRMFDLGITFNSRALIGDIEQCLDGMNLRFEKQSGQLVLQHGPLKFWPGGMGVYGNTTATATTAASNGFPALTNVRRWRNPRILSANEQFQYVVNVPNANLPTNNVAIALSSFVEITIWLFGQVLDAIPN